MFAEGGVRRAFEEVGRPKRIEPPLGGDFQLAKTGDFEMAIDITVPELPWIQTGAHKRSDIDPAARNAIASALQVPPYFFDLHFHIEG